ncbi:MAG: marine proteobacterial sortase target protein, partial [Granulosicoccaceae bacterium]
KYLNNGPDFIAGEYVFPLPDGASIDSLVVKVGGRRIDAKLREKARAKAQFEQAKREGKQAALLQQDRANLFRMTVANIGAGEEIEVQLTYLDTVQQERDNYSLSLPTTLTPRYSPPQPVHEAQESTSSVDDLNDFLNPLFSAEAHDPTGMPINPIDIRVQLNTGFAAGQPHSDSHEILVQSVDDSHYKVQLTQGYEPMDRDFTLEWQQQNATIQPQLYLEPTTSQTDNGDTPSEVTLLLSLTPSASQYVEQHLPKDISFIIDTSGSMGGVPIRQAKAALLQGLENLGPQDSFNIIEFNSSHTSLFASSQPAHSQNLAQARNFVQNLVADGGTEMKPALLDALRRPATSAEHLKQVVFITDGAVGNESELSRVVHQFLGEARLFSVAIGAAPNRYLFRQLSKLGKGSHVSIDQSQEVQSKMQSLFDKISRPAMRDIEIHDPDGKILEIQPSQLPDLYYGEPLEVLLKRADTEGQLTIKGTIAGESLEIPLSLADATAAPGVAKLWGKQKISALMDKIHLGQGDPAQLRQTVVDLSLKHKILSQYTSYVAVDEQVVRRADQPLHETQITNLAPKGMAFPNTALGTLPTVLLSLLSLLLAAIVRVFSNNTHFGERSQA